MATESKAGSRWSLGRAWREFREQHASRISEFRYSLFLFRKNYLAVLGLALIIAVIAIAFLAPNLAIQQPYYQLAGGEQQQRWIFHDICRTSYPNAAPTPPVLIGAPSVTAYVGTNLSFEAVTSDPEVPADTLNWTWHWGDSTQTTLARTTAQTGIAAHAWTSPGSFVVTVDVGDGYGVLPVTNAGAGVSVNVVLPPAGLGEIQGRISDTSPGRLPIAGVQVTASPGGFSAMTGSDGLYAMALPAGTYNVSARGWLLASSYVAGVAVVANATSTANLSLASNAGWIVGTVTGAPSGAPVPTAQVTARGPAGFIEEVGADAQGRYNLSVAPGAYALSVIDAQRVYNTANATNVSVAVDAATQVPFTLQSIAYDCQVFLAPSLAHPFGSDNFGEDWYSKVLYGAGVSLEVGILVVIPVALIGSLLGLLAGYRGGLVEEVIMRVTDIFLSIPSLILAIAITAVLGRSIIHVMYALIITWWPWYTRIVRGQVLSVKERQFVESARSVGATSSRLMLRHILPNSISPVVVQASMDFGYVILTAAGLGFLGLGAPPGTAEWGVMISEGITYLFNAPWMSIFPGLAIVLTVLGFNLFGDGLRDILDPRLRR